MKGKSSDARKFIIKLLSIIRVGKFQLILRSQPERMFKVCFLLFFLTSFRSVRPFDYDSHYKPVVITPHYISYKIKTYIGNGLHELFAPFNYWKNNFWPERIRNNVGFYGRNSTAYNYYQYLTGVGEDITKLEELLFTFDHQLDNQEDQAVYKHFTEPQNLADLEVFGSKIHEGLIFLKNTYVEIHASEYPDVPVASLDENLTKAKKLFEKIIEETNGDVPSRTLVSQSTMDDILYNITTEYPEFTAVPTVGIGHENYQVVFAKTGFGDLKHFETQIRIPLGRKDEDNVCYNVQNQTSSVLLQCRQYHISMPNEKFADCRKTPKIDVCNHRMCKVSGTSVKSCSVNKENWRDGHTIEVVFHPELFHNKPEELRQLTIECNGQSSTVIGARKEVFSFLLPYGCSVKNPFFTVDEMNLPYSSRNVPESTHYFREYYLNDTSIERKFNNFQTIQMVRELREDIEITNAIKDVIEMKMKEQENLYKILFLIIGVTMAVLVSVKIMWNNRQFLTRNPKKNDLA